MRKICAIFEMEPLTNVFFNIKISCKVKLLYRNVILMDDIYEISMLLDFYGQLITRRLYEILDLHYNNDYSLGEIAEHLKISRQGVYDGIKRGKSQLENFEKKLGLVKKFSEQRKRARMILKRLNGIDDTQLSERDKKVLKDIGNELKSLTEDF